jgi:TRAP-type C4-dicarboxylate transport system permease small subunit
MIADVLESLGQFTRKVNGLFLAISGVLALAILAAISWDLVARNVFDSPTLWALDASRFLMLFLFFLAVGPTLESNSHVNVDLLDHYLSPGPKRVMRILAIILALIFGCFLLWQIWRTTYEAFVEDGLFPTVVPIKMKYVYWIAPIGIMQFLLTGIVQLAEAVYKRPFATPVAAERL